MLLSDISADIADVKAQLPKVEAEETSKNNYPYRPSLNATHGGTTLRYSPYNCYGSFIKLDPQPNSGTDIPSFHSMSAAMSALQSFISNTAKDQTIAYAYGVVSALSVGINLSPDPSNYPGVPFDQIEAESKKVRTQYTAEGRFDIVVKGSKEDSLKALGDWTYECGGD